MLTLQILPQALTVCKVADLSGFALSGLYFIGNTDSELSLVCETDKAPANTVAREEGWRAMRVVGQLDFSLTGILSGHRLHPGQTGKPRPGGRGVESSGVCLYRSGALNSPCRLQ